jgi:hypothetical protein
MTVFKVIGNRSGAVIIIVPASGAEAANRPDRSITAAGAGKMLLPALYFAAGILKAGGVYIRSYFTQYSRAYFLMHFTPGTRYFTKYMLKVKLETVKGCHIDTLH